MQIQNYGLFWRRDEVEWNPGTGKKFELLGRIGEKRSILQIADFRYQQGIYTFYMALMAHIMLDSLIVVREV